MPLLRANPAVDSSLAAQIYTKLRHDIISGTIASGTRLLETTLSARLKVSRTPVREALHKLALEGLLVTLPRAGFIVAEMSVHDIADLFATRAEIERIAVRWALRNISPEEIRQMEQNLSKTAAALEKRKTASMIDLDADFHDIIYKASRSRTLYLIAQTLSDHTLKFRKACIHVPDVAERARGGHTEIYRAIRDKNAQRAEKAVEKHLEQVQEDILACLERLRKASMFE
jgi:DNA-binding GntR family transcriptional regulator